jgi:hypothetical protein
VKELRIPQAQGELVRLGRNAPAPGLHVRQEGAQLGLRGPLEGEGLQLRVDDPLDLGPGRAVGKVYFYPGQGRGALLFEGGGDAGGKPPFLLEPSREPLASEDMEGRLDGEGIVGPAARGSPAVEQHGSPEARGQEEGGALAGLLGDQEGRRGGPLLAASGLEEAVDELACRLDLDGSGHHQDGVARRVVGLVEGLGSLGAESGQVGDGPGDRVFQGPDGLEDEGAEPVQASVPGGGGALLELEEEEFPLGLDTIGGELEGFEPIRLQPQPQGELARGEHAKVGDALAGELAPAPGAASGQEPVMLAAE